MADTQPTIFAKGPDMQLSASFCRTQQAIHDARANSPGLDNVRMVAGKAAKAWGNEADLADRREAQRQRARPANPVAHPFDDEDSPMFSENPDRGLSAA
jgi:hypothetical protein